MNQRASGAAKAEPIQLWTKEGAEEGDSKDRWGCVSVMVRITRVRGAGWGHQNLSALYCAIELGR
eukprot:605266-Rhodomonas_salina.2